MSASVVVFIFNDALIKLAAQTMPPLQAIGLRGPGRPAHDDPSRPFGLRHALGNHADNGGKRGTCNERVAPMGWHDLSTERNVPPYYKQAGSTGWTALW